MSSRQERERFLTSAEGLCGAQGCSRHWWHHEVLLASLWGDVQRVLPGRPPGTPMVTRQKADAFPTGPRLPAPCQHAFGAAFCP